MNDPNLLPILIGVGVIVLFGGASLVLSRSGGSVAEQRLDGLSGGCKAKKVERFDGHARAPAGDRPGLGPSFWSKLVPNVENLNRLYEQADVNIPFERFMIDRRRPGGRRAASSRSCWAALPLCASRSARLILGGMPFLWLIKRKKKRIQQFVDAMPEAVELIGRALRAGHGLASGMQPRGRGDEGPDRRRVRPGLRGAEPRHPDRALAPRAWPTASRRWTSGSS